MAVKQHDADSLSASAGRRREREHLREHRPIQRDVNVLNRSKKKKKKPHENQVIDKSFYFPIVLGPRPYLRLLSSADAITCMPT